MVKDIPISRQHAELIIDVLEYNYEQGLFEPSGVGADFASHLREQFGMPQRIVERVNHVKN